jgi:cephalosporin hydroxylase
MDQQDLIRRFNCLYYDGPAGKPLYMTTSWLGVPTLKCPLDTWIYQEILHQTRPEVIVETGVMFGGSSLYLASICDLNGIGQVIACDVTLAKVYPLVLRHPRISFVEGSSVDPTIFAKIRQACDGKRTMVILDSDHSERHVLEELRLYSQLVTPGCYLICEDTNINGHPVLPSFGPGPREALEQFLRESAGWLVDRDCERLLVTFNPSGYLLRLKGAA